MFRDTAPHASAIAAVAWYLIAVGGAVVLAVLGALIVVWWRRADDDGAHDDLRHRHGELADGERSDVAVRWLGVYVPIAILVITFGVAVGAVVAVEGDADAPVTVEITGRQWFWDVRYLDADGHELARTANEIHLPEHADSRLLLTSADVIHSFWVPGLDRKMDLVPGRTNTLVVAAGDPGEYEGACAEFCGVQHTNMRLLVVVDSDDDFRTWLAGQGAPAAVPDSEQEVIGQQVLLGSACAYCHTIAGTNATGRVGPDLTHVASRRDLAAGTIPNTDGYLGGWLLDPQHIKPGNKMPASALSGDEVIAVIDYLRSLR
jgi:cytochrome c oxidase subunit II